MKSKILVTGGSGFLGKALLENLFFSDALSIGRTPTNHAGKFLKTTLDAASDYSHILSDVDIIVHLAARAHVTDDLSGDVLQKYRSINTLATLNLAKQAAAKGVNRFVFVSSIKVLGENTKLGRPFTADCPLNPQDPYSLSKAEAEIGLLNISKNTNMEMVIIRPPLVYGKYVKGNLASLAKFVKHGVPMPFLNIINQRSLIGIDNLVDLVVTCINHPRAANQIFLASDGHDLSTPELLHGIAHAMGKPSRLFPCPLGVLASAAKFVGRKENADRLLGSLQVDISKTKRRLGWEPPLSVEDGLSRCFL